MINIDTEKMLIELCGIFELDYEDIKKIIFKTLKYDIIRRP